MIYQQQRLVMSATKSKAALQERFVGKTLQEVPTPSIVLDLAKLEVNCQRMIDAADKNGIGWRAHIKTHKVSLSSTHVRDETLKRCHG